MMVENKFEHICMYIYLTIDIIAQQLNILRVIC